MRVKGKKEPVTVLELIGRREELPAWWAMGVPGPSGAAAPSGIAGKETEDFLSTYMRGLSAFHSRDFAQSAELFERCLTLRPLDGPCRIYLERCRGLLASPPPPDWDLAVTMETK